MDEILIKKSKALKYLGATTKGKKRFTFSKLGNELTLITTKICNLNCPYCYDKANITDKKNLKNCEKNELTAKEIITLIQLCKRIGVKTVRFTGGEALLKKNFMEILKECKGMYVTICTNGLILDKKIKEIISIHPEDLHIHLSLDGIKTHKKYRIGSSPYKVIDSSKKIKKLYPSVKVSINTVLNGENVNELTQMYPLIKKSLCDRWTVSYPRLVENAIEKNFRVPYVSDLNKAVKKLMGLYEKDKKPFDFTISYFQKFELLDKNKYTAPIIRLESHPCLPDASGAKGLIIDSFGNILDCLVLKPLMKKPINIKKILDRKNVSPDDLIKKLNDSLQSKFYNLKLKDKKECLDCRYMKLCKGGCPANAYYMTKSLKNVDAISCLMFHNFEEKLLPYFKEKEIYRSLIDSSKSKTEVIKKIKKNKEILVKIGSLR